VLVFDGDARRFARRGFDVIPQRGADLGERLASAFEDVTGPALLVGMDTPQLTSELLLDGMRALRRPRVDAVLGPALDGGYWSIGFGKRATGAFEDVPMSCSDTWFQQRARLLRLGLSVHDQSPLRDVDTIEDAQAVAGQAPGSRFARALGALGA
jgi:glycosyltransferase A (GT-A) superfamily protein (DUF2064 family)